MVKLVTPVNVGSPPNAVDVVYATREMMADVAFTDGDSVTTNQ